MASRRGLKVSTVMSHMAEAVKVTFSLFRLYISDAKAKKKNLCLGLFFYYYFFFLRIETSFIKTPTKKRYFRKKKSRVSRFRLVGPETQDIFFLGLSYIFLKNLI